MFFADFGLLSYDMDGRERWRLPLGPFNNLYGMGASPVLVDDLVVLVCDQNIESFIVAVGQRDGRVRWKTARPEAHSRHSTPILHKPAGASTQVIVAGSFLLTAYAADTGEKVWWVRGLCFELKSTPVVSGDTLYNQRIRNTPEPARLAAGRRIVRGRPPIRRCDGNGNVRKPPERQRALVDRPRFERRRVRE